MKKFTLLLLSFIATFAAQAQNTLIIDNGNLIWQKIYYTSRTQSDIITSLRTSGKVANIDITDEVIVCNIPSTKFDYEAAGFKRGSTPMYLLGNDFTAFVRIQIKEDRYRVTVSDILLTTSIETPISKIGETTEIEFYAVKNELLTKEYVEKINKEKFDELLSNGKINQQEYDYIISAKNAE